MIVAVSPPHMGGAAVAGMTPIPKIAATVVTVKSKPAIQEKGRDNVRKGRTVFSIDERTRSLA